MLDLVLTRHGTTTAGEAVLGGQLDVELSELGRSEAEALARRLEGVRIDRIVASPMVRAMATAEIVARGRPFEIDERLRELDYGRWEGLSGAELEVRDPDLRIAYDADPAATHAPGGESGNDVAIRTRSFLESLLVSEHIDTAAAADLRRPADAGGSRHRPAEDSDEAATERRVLVVAHGTLDRILMCVALNVPIRDFRRRFVIDRAGLSVIRYESGDGPADGQLILANDVSHLRRPGETPWG
jgi:probable phosphoglycerate mutase